MCLILGLVPIPVCAFDCRTEFANFVTARAAKKELADFIENVRRNPEALGPIRLLDSRDVTISDINSGNPFSYSFDPYYSQKEELPPVPSMGKKMSIRLTDGNSHEISIITPLNENAKQLLNSYTNNVLDYLPAETITSLRTIELLPNETRGSIRGFAGGGDMTILQPGINELRVFTHENGHLVAQSVFGDTSPYVFWPKAVFKDFLGGKPGVFVSGYARLSIYNQSALKEDFADAVALYLKNPDKFRANYPNRCAILDSIFRGANQSIIYRSKPWETVRSYYVTGTGYNLRQYRALVIQGSIFSFGGTAVVTTVIVLHSP